MRTVGSYEAKTRLTELLREVERGETITITRHGQPVAILQSPGSTRTADATRNALAALRTLRQGKALGLSWQDARDEGRR